MSKTAYEELRSRRQTTCLEWSLVCLAAEPHQELSESELAIVDQKYAMDISNNLAIETA